MNIIGRHVSDLSDVSVKCRLIQGGKYVAVTAVVEAKGKQQLDNIYSELSAHEKVIIAL